MTRWGHVDQLTGCRHLVELAQRLPRLASSTRYDCRLPRLGLQSKISTRTPDFMVLTISFIKPVTVNLEQLHPDFCLTIQELVVFLNAAAYFRHLHAKLCDFNQSDFEVEVCRFENLSVLKPDCVYIVGDLNINNGDEELVQKLEKVEIIFGSLVIQNTLLKNLDFFGNLRKIANFNETAPIIKIVNNENLRKIELPKMDGSISKGYSVAIIEGTEVFESTQSCMIFQFHTRTNVSYNGGNCSEFLEQKEFHFDYRAFRIIQ
ncbi:hypothetical protein CAEBREN_05579 [Caenorhabditis brenneri]|uniref:Receptor L-domain domain-containing protein n=1 Tax=Caenorhabditis brenneri TaxID=135651 RepID=G0P861_CAEBE|nr:hypothetical protein CAEBREN_05579 [Caenorhabditis brenneri]